jgi:hypothetical protein
LEKRPFFVNYSRVEHSSLLRKNLFSTTGQGVILAQAENKEKIEAIISEDPFLIEGVAKYQVVEFQAGMSIPAFEQLLSR